MIKDTSGQDVVLEKSSVNKVKLAAGVITVLVLIAVLSLVFAKPSANKSVDMARVQIATLETGDLVRDIIANGRIVAANAPQLYAPEQGFVELTVNAGDSVEYGQVLAVVESPELQNKLEQERSEQQRLEGQLARQELDARRQTLQLTKQLDLAEVDLQAAERENRRAQKSIINNLISQIDLEKAVDDLARAQLNFKHAKQEVDLAKDTLAFELDVSRSTLSRQKLIVEELERKIQQLNVTASVTGVVGNLLVQHGALVDKNMPLMTLVDLTAYEAEVNVAESYASELSIGLPVELRIGNSILEGTLAAVSPEIKNREVTTRVKLHQPDLTMLRQNQQVTARVLLDNKSNVLKVKRGSFMQSGGFIAYKLEGNIAHKVDIEVGAKSMREVEILTGLQANDQIIISNYQEFIDADTVLLRN
ncbi:efflux RND transporter periplasmic adaptor subunit [Glaciecola sp. 1036]|uniref:efflux RND transporter periplasmic adaptor subunit n=1 Tax=Alteromonadaceae TaxID=72275 RepID=UPI003CFE2132